MPPAVFVCTLLERQFMVMTRIIVHNMVMTQTISLSHAKARLTRLLSEVEELGEEVVITRSGRPVGVLMAFQEYEGLLETLEVLADQELAAAVRQGLAEAAEGKTLGEAEVWDGLDDPLHG
jgi:prevent-host-death family protein